MVVAVACSCLGPYDPLGGSRVVGPLQWASGSVEALGVHLGYCAAVVNVGANRSEERGLHVTRNPGVEVRCLRPDTRLHELASKKIDSGNSHPPRESHGCAQAGLRAGSAEPTSYM